MPRMAKRQRLTPVFAPETLDHLDAIDRKYHGLIQTAIDEQLSFAPEEETRNRKPLRQPAPCGGTWELRCGPRNCFRVFYRVPPDEGTVRITAIGVKDRDKLFFAGKEFEP